MTSVTRDSFAGGSAGRGVLGRGAALRRPGSWRRLWQVPLLIAGLALFALATRALVKAIHPVPFAQQIQGVHATLEKGEFATAIEQINTLGDYYKEKNQAAQLQALAGDTFYYASKAQGGTVRGNWEKVLDHYRKAIALGSVPTPLMNERWGQAALALGDARLAIEKFEAAGQADPSMLAEHGQDLVAAYLSLNQYEKAEETVDRVLARPQSGVDERVWGLCKKIELAMAQQGGAGAALNRALQAALAAVREIPERDPSGRVYLWIGRAEYEQGQIDAAREHLELARSKFLVHNLDDGRTTVLLGKIAQAKGDLQAARDCYQEVVTSHAGTTVWAAARLGRAEISALQGDPNAQMEADYHYVIKALMDGGPVGIGEGKGPPELVTLDQVRASLVAEFQRYSGANRLDDAMKFMALQEDLKDPETAATAWRLATTREKRAGQLLQEAATQPAAAAADNAKSDAQKSRAMDLLRQSAEDYLRHARLTTMEDTVSAASYWKAAQLFDQAGETTRSIDAYEKFTLDRPRDPRVPDAWLAIGRLYQSAGKLDQAIAYYQRNIDWNPKTPAAYTSRVNLAWCFMAQGPDHFPQAEQSLLKLVQENADIEPTANEFRESLFALGELYYRWGKWREAILRLEEAVGRYPDDPGIPRADFMLAESYRRSALDIGAALQKGGLSERRDVLEKARTERLLHAADLLCAVIGLLDAQADAAPPPPDPAPRHAQPTALQEAMLRASYMDRADCYFSAGDYAMAIRLYDLAATRFALDVTAADAYVQIVNAYRALQQPAQAAAAAQRAQWVVKRIPDQAFGQGPVPLTRQYYEELFALMSGKHD